MISLTRFIASVSTLRGVSLEDVEVDELEEEEDADVVDVVGTVDALAW